MAFIATNARGEVVVVRNDLTDATNAATSEQTVKQEAVTDNVERGWYLHADGSVHPFPEKTDTDRGRIACRGVQSSTIRWVQGVNNFSVGEISDDKRKEGIMRLRSNLRAMDGIMHNRPQISGTPFANLTADQKIAWANANAEGAADVQSPAQFFSLTGAVAVDIDMILTWTNPAGVSVNLADSLELGALDLWVPDHNPLSEEWLANLNLEA